MMNENKARELHFENGQIVKVKVDSDKGGMMEAFVKVTKNGFYEVHIDKDDANAFLLENGDQVEIER